jgi:hypothetical protein
MPRSSASRRTRTTGPGLVEDAVGLGDLGDQLPEVGFAGLPAFLLATDDLVEEVGQIHQGAPFKRNGDWKYV